MTTEGKFFLPIIYIIAPAATITYVWYILPVTGLNSWGDFLVMTIYLSCWTFVGVGTAFRLAGWWDRRKE